MSYFVFKQINKNENTFRLFSGPYDDYFEAEQSYSEKLSTVDDQDAFVIHNLKSRKVRKIKDIENIAIDIRSNKFDPRKTRSTILECCDPLTIDIVVNGKKEDCKIENIKGDCVLVSFNTAATGYRQIYLNNSELQESPVVREWAIEKSMELSAHTCRVEFYTNFNERKRWTVISPLLT